MNKPIPQDVLASAKAIFDWTEAEMLPKNSIEYLARELMAAEQRGKDQMARIATDYRYMMEAYEIMLGPKALEVVAMWKDNGVKRFHASWGPDAAAMTGEERAQVLLGWEGVLNSARLVEDVDSTLTSNQEGNDEAVR